jgi:hypothetical protein
MSMHGGTRNGFVSAACTVFFQNVIQSLGNRREPFPAGCMKEVKIIISLTFEYMTAWLHRKLSFTERFSYIV